MAQPSDTRSRLSAARIALLYFVVSTLYILFSDRILLSLTDNAKWLADLQTAKGIGFITLTAALLFWLIHVYSQSLKKAQVLEREAADRLRAEQAKLTSIIDSMGDGLIVVSNDVELQLVNPTAASILGVSAQPLPIREWPHAYAMHDVDKRTPLDADDLPIMRALHGEAVARQSIYLKAGGPVRWLTMSARPILGADGAIDGAVAVVRDSTQSMQTNEALRESQRRLLTLLSNLPGMAYRCRNDKQWTMEFVSEGVEELTGYTWLELTSNEPCYGDLIHSDDEGMVWEEVQNAVKRHQPFQLMYRIMTRSGELRWVWEQGRGVFDDSGTLLAVEGFIFDITAHKFAEDKLAESEVRFRGLIENSTDVITLLDSHGIIVYQSPSAERTLGYGGHAMIGKRGLDLVAEDEQPRVRELFKAALDHPGRVWPLEFRIRHADGNWRHVEAALKLYTHHDPGCIVVCNLRDVTERKMAEAEIRQLAAAVEQTAEALLICGPDGVMHYANPAALEMALCECDELRGKPVQKLLAQAEGEALVSMASFEDALRHGTTWQGRLIGRRRNGETFPCDVALSPVRGEGEVHLHGVVVMRDMTREVRIEAQVRQQQKLEAIGTLAGGIAHDFNNILSAILGFTEMAMLGLSDEQKSVARDLEQVVKAGQRARDLVRHILTFSRKTEVGRAPVKSDLVLEEALQLLRATLPSNIELDSSISTDCDPVLMDPTHLHQVVMNLCINSFQAMREHGGRMSVASRQIAVDEGMAHEYLDLTPGEYVQISVRDTGHGMDRSVMEHIFEPFFTTKGEQEGTGLGLSTAYGVVKEAGGSIVAYSEKGRGTTMQVYLPAHSVAATPEKPVRTILGQGRGERILVVDDEPAIATVASKMLERLGYSAEPFTDGRAALARFQEQPDTYDAVLTDYSMPEVSGLQLASEIRAIRSSMPVLLTSGFHEAFQRRDAGSLPIDEVVAKPFDYQSLAAALERAIRRPAGERENTASSREGVRVEMQ